MSNLSLLKSLWIYALMDINLKNMLEKWHWLTRDSFTHLKETLHIIMTLNKNLEEENYMNELEGFSIEGKGCKLMKSLYELK